MSHGKYLSELQAEAVREVIRVEALAGEWLPIPDEFYSGYEIGFDVADVSVRATVEFDKYEVTIIMTSPVENMSHRAVFHRQQSFFSRNRPGASLFVNGIDGGPATSECINAAKDLLIGLYTDWKILQSRKETVRRKMDCFPEFAVRMLAEEKERTAPVKERIRVLSQESSLLKRRFKAGEFSQKEYMKKRRPIHEEIVSLMDQVHEKDPFGECFSEELADCRYASDRRAMIKSVATAKS